MAAVVFAACDKENETPGQKIDPAELVEVTFDVSAKKSTISDVEKASTKTEIKEDGTVLWSVGDKVSVFYEVNGATGSSESEALTAENIKADGSASITVKVPAAFTLEQFEGTRSLSAVYPYDATATFEGGKINVSAPKVQDGTFAHASLSVAEWTGSNSLTFKNQCGLLRIEAVDAAVSKITLKSADADVATLIVSGAGTYYAAVAPSALEGFSVVLTDADGEELARRLLRGLLSSKRVMSFLSERWLASMTDSMFLSKRKAARTEATGTMPQGSQNLKLFLPRVLS